MMTLEDMRLWKAISESFQNFVSFRRADLQIESQSSLDLHGMTLNEAFEKSKLFVRDSRLKSVVIITGRSGSIRQEFPDWIKSMPRIKNYSVINEGSFRLKLK